MDWLEFCVHWCPLGLLIGWIWGRSCWFDFCRMHNLKSLFSSSVPLQLVCCVFCVVNRVPTFMENLVKSYSSIWKLFWDSYHTKMLKLHKCIRSIRLGERVRILRLHFWCLTKDWILFKFPCSKAMFYDDKVFTEDLHLSIHLNSG